MTHVIQLDVLEIKCTDAKWDALVRQYAVEDRNQEYFLIASFPELATRIRPDESPAMQDALDIILYKAVERFKIALWKKYRIGEEFSDDSDHDLIWNKIFITARSAARQDKTGYIGIEIYYWVVLQLVREVRGEYLDKVYQGAETRLGQYGRKGFRNGTPDLIILQRE